jgi:hypothetical protein
MTLELFALVAGFAITVGTIIYSNGKSSGKIETWMQGHEKLDASRFDDIKKDIARLDAKL